MKIIIVDNRISKKCERSLEKEGFYLIKLPPDQNLGEAVRSHPDTVMFYCNGEIITTAEYCDTTAYIFSDIREFAPHIKICFTNDRRSDRYPFDCVLNALLIGKKIFCKTDTISDGIRDFAYRHGYELIYTKQGYPACSVLAFGGSAITADRGLAATLENNGIKVTLINDGGISLPPHQYGFIGGASGVVGNRVYFFGDLDLHPDANIIREAIISEGFIPVSLSDEELSDFGGIIAI